jgi:predicted dehydrogenase
MKGAAGMAGLSLARSSGPALGAQGANEKVVMGFIGTGGQGTAHIKEFAKMKDVAIAAVCDVDQAHREKAAKTADSSPKQLKDFRELLDMKDIDAVLVATPDHWHGIVAIEACKAGKDIYCEKPMTHNIREGRLLLDAVKQHNRIVQIGTQQRSSRHWINAVERIKAGEIGKVHMVHVWNAWSSKQMRGNLGHPPDEPVPEGVDYDMWLGPAPKRPFNKLRFHWLFYFFWDYAGGMVSDWAVHLFDVVCWVMGPGIKSVSMVGGKHAFNDARDTPDTVAAGFDCQDYTMVYTMRHDNGWTPHGDQGHGIEFFGQDRTLQINRRGFQICRDEDRGSRKPCYEEKGNTPMWDHERNFIECVRSRKRPNADAQNGYDGQIPCHLANISYRVGRRVYWDAKNETIPNGPGACKLLTRTYREPWVL